MSNKNVGVTITISALIAVVIWLLVQKTKDEKIKNKLQDALNSQNLLTETIRAKLLVLLEQNPHIDESVKAELTDIAALLSLQQEASAILKLAKIIENLLKKLFKHDPEFKGWYKNKGGKRSPDFAHFLDFAYDKKMVSKEDYHNISALKSLRNQEAHEMNIAKDKTKLVGFFIAGLIITVELYNLVIINSQKLFTKTKELETTEA